MSSRTIGGHGSTYVGEKFHPFGALQAMEGGKRRMNTVDRGEVVMDDGLADVIRKSKRNEK